MKPGSFGFSVVTIAPLHLDKYVEIATYCKHLPEKNVKRLFDHVCDLLLEESNVEPVSALVIVCGRIHAQIYHLWKLFRTGGEGPVRNDIFMGDFVDRGYYSLETFTRLLALKVTGPGSYHTSTCKTRKQTNNSSVRPFWLLPNRIQKLKYLVVLHKSGGTCWWWQPWQMSRSCVFLVAFHLTLRLWTSSAPSNATKRILIGKFSVVLCGQTQRTWSPGLSVHEGPGGCLAPRLLMSFSTFMFDEKPVTVWSAPNHCYSCVNIASIMVFKGEMRVQAAPCRPRLWARHTSLNN